DVAGGLVDAQAHHQLAGLVWRPGALAVKEVRRERHESGFGETIRHMLDMGDEAPPLLYDDDAGARFRGTGEVAGRAVSGAFEPDALTHPASPARSGCCPPFWYNDGTGQKAVSPSQSPVIP